MPFSLARYPITIPDDPSRRKRCVECVRTQIAQRPGIRSASVVAGQADGQAVIELEYDSGVVSMAQLDRYLALAGACLNKSLAHTTLTVTGINSTHVEATVEATLNRVPGVRATANFSSQTVRLEFDRAMCPMPQVVERLHQLGLDVKSGLPAEAPKRPAPTTMSLFQTAIRQPDLVTAVFGGMFLLAGFLVHVTGGSNWLRLSLLAAAYLLCGWHTVIDVVRVLAQVRFDIDVLMFAAAVGAATLGHYEEGALLLLLFALGGAGERLAIARARSAIEAFSHLMPDTAVMLVRKPDGTVQQHQVSVQSLRVGDQVLIAPGQRVPADGLVADGASAVDQAPITGESIPVDKAPGAEVFAGTINGEGALTVTVSKVASENTLAKVVRLVEEAQTTRSPTQVFTARVERWYVPLVLIATVVIAVVPVLLGWEPGRSHTSHWQGWFYQAMAFLTAASPCALAIGTPAAVLSGIARAARAGVLIKGGVHLENLARIKVVALDKTGTLTEGRPAVTDVLPMADGINAMRLLSVAAALERGSRHPLAAAIVAEADARRAPRLEATSIEQKPGVGIAGMVEGRTVAVSRPNGASDARVDEEVTRLSSNGKTVVVIAEDGRPIGVIAMADRIRPRAAEMVQDLHKQGIQRTIMLTGDNARSAAAVATALGIREYYADLLPEDKMRTVRELNDRYHGVAMLGDGVNDAPALANATVGIAIGGPGGGSDVALETADVVLLSSSVDRLPEVIALSRFSRRIIVQNLVIALGVIAVLAPMAAMGLTPISIAVLFHEGSTVVVVLNSLRILGWKRR